LPTNPSACRHRKQVVAVARYHESPHTGDGAALADLLTAVGSGDRAAFAALFDRTAALVYGTALRILRDPTQSEEVTQEAFLDVWRTAARFDSSRGSAVAWVSTIAHHRAVDRVCAERAAAERERRVLAAQVAYDEVVESAHANLEHERVRRCLSALTDLQREAVVLAYYGGYTYREVASLLDVPTGTIKTRMRDGLIRLRDCLGVDE
jgi:RNA polymerase sigma-70 factor (ECF subfamily)